MNRKEQIVSHGVNIQKYPFASFCFGRGWSGHLTAAAAAKAASRDAARAVRTRGGNEPQHGVAETDTGRLVSGYMM